MKRWPAIATLGVMAWPAAFFIGAGFVGLVESWKAGFLTTSCRPGLSAGAHALCPVSGVAISSDEAFQVVGVITLAIGLWWAGWFLELRSARKAADPSSAFPLSSLLLALWFFGSVALTTIWAANVHTFM